MALQVWLPLNGNLDNQGLSNIVVSNNGATIDNNGKIGKCYSFNGSSNYITIPSLEVPENFSISIWGKWNSLNDYSRLVDFGSLASGNGYGFLIGNDSTTSTMIFGYECGNGSLNINIGTITINTWYHIVLTFQSTDIKAYLNGNLITTITTASPVGGHTLNYNYLGKSNWSADALLNGSLNDFRIYDHCLSAKEVKEISKGLVCHYKLSGVGGENLVSDSLINETSYEYGFASRTVQIESGKQYTLSVKGYISEDAKNDGTTLKIYAYRSDWRYCPLILSISDTKETIVTGTFTANQTIDLFITSYSYLEQYKSGNAVTVLWYKFEEGSKATPWCPNPSDALYSTLGYNDGIEYDCSGYGNNGTKVGNIAWSGDSARYSGSYYFSKSASRYIYRDTRFGFLNNLTFSCWIYQMDRATVHGTGEIVYQFVMSQGRDYRENANFSYGFNIVIVNGYVYIISLNTYANTGYQLDLNKWYHICQTFDGSYIKVYVNGECIYTIADNTTDLWNNDGNAFAIGKMSFSCTSDDYFFPFVGKISDARVYATALSESDVKSLYNVSASIDKTGVLFCGEVMEN